MIILYNKDETSFTSLGKGVLRDAIYCSVMEELNGGFELEMQYPITGSHYNDINNDDLILVKPNMFDDPQPFRIYEISIPIDGVVTIKAQHISYDMSNFTVKPFEATDLSDALTKIQNGSILESPFIFSTDKTVSTTMKIDCPYNMRSLLAGQTGSLLDIYGGEFKFNKYNVQLLNHRGSNKGFSVRYGKNMSDLKIEITSEKNYTGVFPFYYSKTQESVTYEESYYQQVYFTDKEYYGAEWFSLSDGGMSFLPLVKDVPIQAAEGVYSQSDPNLAALVGHVFIWTDEEIDGEIVTHYKDVTNNPDYPPNLKRTQVTTQEVEEYVDLSEYVATDVEDGIVYLDKLAVPKKILTLDMSSNFSEKPSEDALYNKVKQYIQNNEIGNIIKSVTVSFVRLSDSEEYKQFKNLENVQLGDTVKIIYDILGIENTLTVIKTQYDAVSNTYEEIELGKKAASLADTAICNNDNVSALTNDACYADYTTVNILIAKQVTADFIQALNASFSNAQIEELETSKIKCSGIIEASMFDIDKVVSSLLVADNAAIKNTLEAGTVTVKGTIYADAGEIGGCTIYNGVLQVADANITGTISASKLNVKGLTITNQDDVTTLSIDSNGNVNMLGTVNANAGTIGGFEIQNGNIQFGTPGTDTDFRLNTNGDTGYLCWRSNNYHVNSSSAAIKITFTTNLNDVNIYIRSYAEAGNDYTIISNKNAAGIPTSYASQYAKTDTRYDQTSGHALTNYKKVNYTNVQTGDYIYVVYTKSNSGNSGDDRGYFLIPNNIYDNLTISTISGYTYKFDRYEDFDITTSEYSLIIGTNFKVDSAGKLYANAVSITSASDDYLININNDMYSVDKDGNVKAFKSIMTDIYCNTVSSMGFNHWDEQWELGAIDLNTGLDISSNNAIRSSSYIPIEEETKYFYHIGYPNSTLIILYYNDNKQYIDEAEIDVVDTAITSPSNAKYVRFYTDGYYGTEYRSDICINESDPFIDGRYFPYYDNKIKFKDPVETDILLTNTLKIPVAYDSSGVTTYVGLEGLTEASQTTQTCYFTASYNILLNNSIEFTAYSWNSTSSNKVAKNVPERTFITVNYTYMSSNKVLTASTVVIIQSGQSSGSVRVTLSYGIFSDISYITPTNQTYTIVNPQNIALVPLSDNSCNLGNLNRRWATVYAATGTINTSDRREKKDISYDLSKYDSFFDSIKPVSYKFIKNDSDYTHLGFIAQDIKDILDANNLSTKDFAGYVKSGDDENCVYGLRYSEFHALEIYEIQKLKARIAELEKKLEEVKKC